MGGAVRSVREERNVPMESPAASEPGQGVDSNLDFSFRIVNGLLPGKLKKDCLMNMIGSLAYNGQWNESLALTMAPTLTCLQRRYNDAIEWSCT